MSHPLDPICQEDIRKAVTVFENSEHGTEDIAFSNIQLVEPPKETFVSAKKLPRTVKICGLRYDSKSRGFAATINIDDDIITDYTDLPDDAQPPFNHSDIKLARRVMFDDPDCLKVIEEYGVSKQDIEEGRLIHNPWPGCGYVHPSIPKGHRAMRNILFYRKRWDDNIYARPLENLIIHVDLTQKKIAAIEHHGTIPLRDHFRQDHYDKEMLKTRNTILKPLQIVQSKGPSFIVNGSNIKWDHWDLRVSMHPIHGLTLHQISYDKRPILYRAALGDFVVPYGDPDPMHCWKHVLDASEYNVGTTCNSLELNCDCLGEIHYFDSCHMNADGSPEIVKNAICLHEEDFGVAFKHSDLFKHLSGMKNTSITRRNRRLVISSFFTLANYDYGFYWYLYLDGSIEVEVKLTGIVGVSSLDGRTADPKHSIQISDNLASPVHQHIFNFRLDWQLDGGPCRLYEEEVEALPRGDDNPNGNLFGITNLLLSTELEAKRKSNPEKSRCWKVTSSTQKNRHGNYVSYKILPGATVHSLPHPESLVSKRAAFSTYHLWATPYTPNEFYAAGEHPVMGEGNDGLAKYTRNDRSIVDCDLVTWNTIGVTHVPRPEDWPIMPVATCKLSLVPSGFFDSSPIMDLPENFNATCE